MRQQQTLARGARVFGALCLFALTLLSLAWIGRDLTDAPGDPADVWWMWAGRQAPPPSGLPWATTALEPVLALVYVVAAVAVLRAAAAAGTLAVTGLLTVALRAPSLWNLNADWMQAGDGRLTSAALFSVIGAVVVGLIMVITAAVGRHPLDDDDPDGDLDFDPSERPPPRPTTGGAVVAVLLLLAAAGTLAAWEVHWWRRFGWESYQHRLTGEHSLTALLAAPASWLPWTLAVLALFAAMAATARAPLARPLGLVAAGLLLGTGARGVVAAVDDGRLEHVLDLPETRMQFGVASVVGYVLVGLLLLVCLGRAEHEDEPPRDWPPPGEEPYGARDPYGPQDPWGQDPYGPQDAYGPAGGLGGGARGGYGRPPQAPPPPPAGW